MEYDEVNFTPCFIPQAFSLTHGVKPEIHGSQSLFILLYLSVIPFIAMSNPYINHSIEDHGDYQLSYRPTLSSVLGNDVL